MIFLCQWNVYIGETCRLFTHVRISSTYLSAVSFNS